MIKGSMESAEVAEPPKVVGEPLEVLLAFKGAVELATIDAQSTTDEVFAAAMSMVSEGVASGDLEGVEVHWDAGYESFRLLGAVRIQSFFVELSSSGFLSSFGFFRVRFPPWVQSVHSFEEGVAVHPRRWGRYGRS